MVAVTREMSGSRPLRVSVLRDRYPAAFNSPRNSRHDVRSRLFVPFNFLKSEFDGFTLMSPFNGADLVHVVNRIPFGSRRMICSFESHIPRHFGMADNGLLTKLMMR